MKRMYPLSAAAVTSAARRTPAPLPCLTLSAVAMACLFLGTACSSVRTQSRINPESPLTAPVRSAVVVVVDDRGSVRTVSENRLAKFLNGHGVQAFPSYTNFAVADWSGGFAGPSTTWLDVDQFRSSVYGSGPEIHTTICLESRLYRLDRGELVWTALTALTLGESTDRLESITQALGKIVSQLAKDNVIP